MVEVDLSTSAGNHFLFARLRVVWMLRLSEIQIIPLKAGDTWYKLGIFVEEDHLPLLNQWFSSLNGKKLWTQHKFLVYRGNNQANTDMIGNKSRSFVVF